MAEIAFSTAVALAEAIRQKQLSSEEVLEAHLSHIATHNPQLNAIVVLYEKPARDRAKLADDSLKRGEVWGPLHGVPVTLKDLHSVVGLPSPWAGHPTYAKRVATEDCTVAARLRQAGAVIMGLTNAHFLENNIFGRTNNPWDLQRTPSGSSAGSASAVAAGLSPLDIGNDSLASILRPASYCGVFGMRPTEHRVSNAGDKVFGTQHIFQPFTVSGPLARSVEDLELALSVISGPDGRDMDVPPLQWRAVPTVKSQDLHISWSHTFPRMPLQKEIHDAVEDVVAKLTSLGVHLQQVMPELDYGREHSLAWQFMELTWEEIFRDQGQDKPPLRLDAFYKAVGEREEFVRKWEIFFANWDAFLCPVWVQTAGLHTDKGHVIDGTVYRYEEVNPATESISPLTGLPSVVIPVGLDYQGLPICVQLIGRRWDDERLLAIARLISNATGGFRRPPARSSIG